MGHVDKEQAVFEQLILSQLKKWSSIELNAFSKYTIILTNDNDKIMNVVFLFLLLIFELIHQAALMSLMFI